MNLRFILLVLLCCPTVRLSAADGRPAAASGTPGAANRFAAPGAVRPNFLLLFSDDQTFRALGRLGELEIRTPHLDRLARRGMMFTHAFNPGG